MSDFSYSAFCQKHKVRFCPDDGDCPGCADERCPACGQLPGREGSYSCSCAEDAEPECQHEPDLATLALPQDVRPETREDGGIELIIDVICSKCGSSGSFAVSMKPEDINW